MTQDLLAFGTRLREWRDRTAPEELGLPVGPRRKVPGLRREELAAFADLSVDYLIRLEQGNAVHPSSEVITALGRALRLPRVEIGLLHQLAGLVPPTDLEVPTHLSPGTQRLLDRLGDVPVAAYDATWTLIAANSMWRQLLGVADSTPGVNLVQTTFTDMPTRVRTTPEYRDRLRRSLVADLRSSSVRYPADLRLQALLRELIDHNPAFAAAWSDRRAEPFTAETKQVEHPDFGNLWFDCDVLNAADGDTRVVAYTAPRGSLSAEALTALRSSSPDRPALSATL
ncbi:helix-turn-helix domain-containing protein [Streptomyces sp. NPDC001068]|uniref:helix-turn-helix domain-containing protein n=1 Tax=Streptomyces sp. NPDC001068 TaxID=3364544 RepID=UPI003694330C